MQFFLQTKEWHPVLEWGTEKKKSFINCIFVSLLSTYLWMGARYGFDDSHVLLNYTSLHAIANAVEVAKLHKIGKCIKYMTLFYDIIILLKKC